MSAAVFNTTYSSTWSPMISGHRSGTFWISRVKTHNSELRGQEEAPYATSIYT